MTERMACIEVPALPLQCLLRRQPDWRGAGVPVVVVAEDKPQAKIRDVNEAARRMRVLPGMRYAAGLSLAPGLRADTVDDAEVEEAVAGIARGLLRFSPRIAPSRDEPGVFWLDARGLGRVFAGVRRWAEAIVAWLRAEGWVASVVVGFDRSATSAIARGRRGALVLRDEDEERQRLAEVALERLPIAAALRDNLLRLGLETVGQLQALSPDALRRRFGPEALALHRALAGERPEPVQAWLEVPPIEAERDFEPPLTRTAPIVFVVRQLLPPLLEAIAARHENVALLHLTLQLEKRRARKRQATRRLETTVQPATPTRDEALLVDLVRLRLEGMEPGAPIERLELTLTGSPEDPQQAPLWHAARKRDLDAANRAIARVRAQLGASAVCVVRPRDGHLPEARFAFEPVEALPEPRPAAEHQPVLVRRLLPRPIPLPASSQRDRDGWQVRGLAYGPVMRDVGPFVVAGGWWRREVHRAYHFAEMRRGDLLWVYWDETRRGWFLQGCVE